MNNPARLARIARRARRRAHVADAHYRYARKLTYETFCHAEKVLPESEFHELAAEVITRIFAYTERKAANARRKERRQAAMNNAIRA